jgi:drug/metabolite transporter (DMT)-like permease
MQTNQTTALATFLVVATGALWGLYWLPVRRLGELGLQGAWGTLAIVATATLVLTPFAWNGRARLLATNRIGLASVALGGFAFALYSVGFLYGRVAIIVILFFLTPVWSTLIGRFVMGWPTSHLRLAALAVGLGGLLLVLGADGELPLPQGQGEWLALISGFLWSVATTGIRTKSDTDPGETAFVFAAGAFIGALILAPALEPLPQLTRPGPVLAWAFVAGTLWWGLSMAGLMWATARLEPARVGILLMAEVLVSAASAAVIEGERLGALELAGGAFVILAGVLEVWPQRKEADAIAPPFR